MHTNEDKKNSNEKDKNEVVKPEPETLHTPDPQDEMEGPISSLVQTVNEHHDDTENKDEENKK